MSHLETLMQWKWKPFQDCIHHTVCWLDFWTIKLELSRFPQKVLVYSELFLNREAKITFFYSMNLDLVSLSVLTGLFESLTVTGWLSQHVIVLAILFPPVWHSPFCGISVTQSPRNNRTKQIPWGKVKGKSETFCSFTKYMAFYMWIETSLEALKNKCFLNKKSFLERIDSLNFLKVS